MTGDPDREGTFIVTDIYPDDLGPNPPFEVLPGLAVDDKEGVGGVVKASQGAAGGKRNQDWFGRSRGKLHGVGGEQDGVGFLRGCYPFPVFSQDGAEQANYFCDQ